MGLMGSTRVAKMKFANFLKVGKLGCGSLPLKKV
jgi:hypothetical protein